MTRRNRTKTRTENAMSPRMMFAILIGVLLGAATALTLLAPQHPSSGSLTTGGKPLVGGPFTLTDATGRRVTEKDYAGKAMLVYFGYTNCPDICPAGLQTISAALDKLGEKADRLTPLFISVDPERDTPAVLGEYVKSFHPKIVGLTGSVEEADQAAKAYKVYHKKVELEGSAAGYAIDHSGIIYLMDANGEYLKHFQHNVTIDALAEAIGNKL